MYFTAHTVTIVCTCGQLPGMDRDACPESVRATEGTAHEALRSATLEAEYLGWNIVSNYERGGRTFAPGHAVEVAPGEWVRRVSLVKAYA